MATGVWHHFLATGDAGFLDDHVASGRAGVGFVLDLQAPGGEVIWARHADGTPWSFALLTASSSTVASLRGAAAVAHRLGHERPAGSRPPPPAAASPTARRSCPRTAGRWTGTTRCWPVLRGDAARARLAAGWDRFVMDGLGVRCVADSPG